MTSELAHYGNFLVEIKGRIVQAQTRASLSANAEMIAMYWDVGRLIAKRQQSEGWGSSVIPRLSQDIRNDLPEIKGFSERNIGRMIAFYREYPAEDTILPQPEAKLQLLTENEITAASPDLPQPEANIESNILAGIQHLCTKILGCTISC